MKGDSEDRRKVRRKNREGTREVVREGGRCAWRNDLAIQAYKCHDHLDHRLHHLHPLVYACMSLNQYTDNINMSIQKCCHQWSPPILYGQ